MLKILSNSNIYEGLAMQWQSNAMTELNSLLKQNGVSDRDIREEILGSFFFSLAAELDGCVVGGMKFEGGEYRPMLGFVDQQSKPLELHVSDDYDLHDHVHFQVGDLLDEDEGS